MSSRDRERERGKEKDRERKRKGLPEIRREMFVGVQHNAVDWPSIEIGATGGAVRYIWKVWRNRYHRYDHPEGMCVHSDAQATGCLQGH